MLFVARRHYTLIRQKARQIYETNCSRWGLAGPQHAEIRGGTGDAIAIIRTAEKNVSVWMRSNTHTLQCSCARFVYGIAARSFQPHPVPSNPNIWWKLFHRRCFNNVQEQNKENDPEWSMLSFYFRFSRAFRLWRFAKLKTKWRWIQDAQLFAWELHRFLRLKAARITWPIYIILLNCMQSSCNVFAFGRLYNWRALSWGRIELHGRLSR